MKKTLKYICISVVAACTVLSCKKDGDYYSGKVSPFISTFDLKKSFTGADLTLTTEVMKGATSIKGVVISDFTNGNSPEGLLVLQNSRTVGNGIDSVRGIAINLGLDAIKYIAGDSVHINVEGGVLKRVDNILQITGVSNSSINKVASNRGVKVPVVTIGELMAAPDMYENRLITIARGMFKLEPEESFSGEKSMNDGSGLATLHTNASADFANKSLLPAASLTGVIYFNTKISPSQPQLWMRKGKDAKEVGIPIPSPVIITGYMPDPEGSDANYEYIQLMATQDVDFSLTPFSLVTTNNAGASIAPANGWATGAARTYKFNLTSGTVRKGEFFYVGGTSKLIWGSKSVSMAGAKWITSIDYTANDGADFGTKTNNLLANSGNVAGVAVFKGTTVDKFTVPMDVVMYGGGGVVYNAGPPAVGYRITNTDTYATVNPGSDVPDDKLQQHFYGSGTNTKRFGLHITQANPAGSSFVRLGGVYIIESGIWTVGRSVTNVPMTVNTQYSELETGIGITVLENEKPK